jgi:hypothetical protein
MIEDIELVLGKKATLSALVHALLYRGYSSELERCLTFLEAWLLLLEQAQVISISQNLVISSVDRVR